MFLFETFAVFHLRFQPASCIRTSSRIGFAPAPNIRSQNSSYTACTSTSGFHIAFIQT